MDDAAVEIVVVNEPDIFKLVENVGVEIVGAVASTTLPVPVDVVVPVPPLATGNVPVTAVARLMLVIVLLEPEIVLLVSVSAVPVPTSVVVASGNVMLRAAVCEDIRDNVVPVVAPEGSNLMRLVASNAFTTNVVVSERFLLVSVSAVARPTSVSVAVGRVSVPVLDIVAIMGAVRVLLLSVCASESPTTAPVGTTFDVSTAPVPFPTKKLPDVSVTAPVPPLATGNVPVTAAVRLILEIVFDPPEMVLLVSVSADALPTSVSGPVGRVSVPPLVIVAITGAERVGDVPNTRDPLPVSSLITPASCADVVAANWLRGLPTSAAADADHDKLPRVSPKRQPLAMVLVVVGNTRL